MKKLLSLLVFLSLPLSAAVSDQQQLVDKACTAFSGMMNDNNYANNIKKCLSNAYGVILIPDYIKAGFLIGGEGGSGVVMIKKPDGSWSYPSFVTAAGGSFGLQAGVENSEVLLVVMSDKGMRNLVNDSFTLGADLSIAAGPIGGGLSAQTTANLDADIYAFSHSRGLFGGGALKGTVIKERLSWNEVYYRDGAHAEMILRGNSCQNHGAENLRQLLTNAKSTHTPTYTRPAYNAPPQGEFIDLAKEAAAPHNAAPLPSPSQSGPKELLPWNRG